MGAHGNISPVKIARIAPLLKPSSTSQRLDKKKNLSAEVNRKQSFIDAQPQHSYKSYIPLLAAETVNQINIEIVSPYYLKVKKEPENIPDRHVKMMAIFSPEGVFEVSLTSVSVSGDSDQIWSPEVESEQRFTDPTTATADTPPLAAKVGKQIIVEAAGLDHLQMEREPENIPVPPVKLMVVDSVAGTFEHSSESLRGDSDQSHSFAIENKYSHQICSSEVNSKESFANAQQQSVNMSNGPSFAVDTKNQVNIKTVEADHLQMKKEAENILRPPLKMLRLYSAAGIFDPSSVSLNGISNQICSSEIKRKQVIADPQQQPLNRSGRPPLAAETVNQINIKNQILSSEVETKHSFGSPLRQPSKMSVRPPFAAEIENQINTEIVNSDCLPVRKEPETIPCLPVDMLRVDSAAGTFEPRPASVGRTSDQIRSSEAEGKWNFANTKQQVFNGTVSDRPWLAAETVKQAVGKDHLHEENSLRGDLTAVQSPEAETKQMLLDPKHQRFNRASSERPLLAAEKVDQAVVSDHQQMENMSKNLLHPPVKIVRGDSAAGTFEPSSVSLSEDLDQRWSSKTESKQRFAAPTTATTDGPLLAAEVEKQTEVYVVGSDHLYTHKQTQFGMECLQTQPVSNDQGSQNPLVSKHVLQMPKEPDPEIRYQHGAYSLAEANVVPMDHEPCWKIPQVDEEFVDLDEMPANSCKLFEVRQVYKEWNFDVFLEFVLALDAVEGLNSFDVMSIVVELSCVLQKLKTRTLEEGGNGAGCGCYEGDRVGCGCYEIDHFGCGCSKGLSYERAVRCDSRDLHPELLCVLGDILMRRQIKLVREDEEDGEGVGRCVSCAAVVYRRELP